MNAYNKSGSDHLQLADGSKIFIKRRSGVGAEYRLRIPVSYYGSCLNGAISVRDDRTPRNGKIACFHPIKYQSAENEGYHEDMNVYPNGRNTDGSRHDQRSEDMCLNGFKYDQAPQETRSEKDNWKDTNNSPSESESDNDTLKNDDMIEDSSGNRYLKKEVLKIILSYKKNTRNFFWGDLQKNCNKMNRKFDDRWYVWTRDMMESIDQNEEKMRSIVLKHTHSKIQDICKEVGGDLWCLQTTDKLKRLAGNIRRIEKLIKSKKGVDTCWGRMKYDGTFKNKLVDQQRCMKKKLRRKKAYDVLDYVKYKSRRWDDHYKKLAEKDDISKLYNKN